MCECKRRISYVPQNGQQYDVANVHFDFVLVCVMCIVTQTVFRLFKNLNTLENFKTFICIVAIYLTLKQNV